MPSKKLPATLVKRLRTVVSKAEKRGQMDQVYTTLGRMKNIDHRQRMTSFPAGNTTSPGRRVRQINVLRNFPELGKVAIKRVHDTSAKEVVKTAREMVKWHNKHHNPTTYILLQPNAYAIGKDLVAMAKTNNPNLHEIINYPKELGGTERGKAFCRMLSKKHNIPESFWVAAAGEVAKLFETPARNILVLGFKKGKFVFMPLIEAEAIESRKMKGP